MTLVGPDGGGGIEVTRMITSERCRAAIALSTCLRRDHRLASRSIRHGLWEPNIVECAPAHLPIGFETEVLGEGLTS